MGRYPNTVEENKLRGNPGKRNLPERTGGIPVSELSCPKSLRAAGREKWGELTKIMNDERRLCAGDAPLLEELCRLYDELQDTNVTLEREGPYYSVGIIKRPHPALGNRQAVTRLIMDALQRLGLAPITRSKVPSVKQKEGGALAALKAQVRKKRMEASEQ